MCTAFTMPCSRSLETLVGENREEVQACAPSLWLCLETLFRQNMKYLFQFCTSLEAETVQSSLEAAVTGGASGMWQWQVT